MLEARRFVILVSEIVAVIVVVIITTHLLVLTHARRFSGSSNCHRSTCSSTYGTKGSIFGGSSSGRSRVTAYYLYILGGDLRNAGKGTSGSSFLKGRAFIPEKLSFLKLHTNRSTANARHKIDDDYNRSSNSSFHRLKMGKGIGVPSSNRESSDNPRVYFDITVGDEGPRGRVVFELFKHIAPRTAENFHKLCIGYKDPATGSVLGYAGSGFHRIIPDFMCQGGDFTRHNGTGGLSIYGQRFDDENFVKKHNRPGLLSMANSGPNTNGSQFFITLAECQWLDGRHVVFGKVIEGMDLISQMAREGTSSGRPKRSCIIRSSGEIDDGEGSGHRGADY